MRRAVAVAFLSAAAVAAACASFTGADRAPAPADAAAESMGATADGASDGGGVLFADDFESDPPGGLCAGWKVFGCTALVTTVAPHSGAHACRVCPTPAATDTKIAHDVALPGPGSYGVLVYARADTDAGDTGAFLDIVLNAFLADGGGIGTFVAANTTNLTASWGATQASEHTTDGVGQGSIFLGIPADGGCIVLDELECTYSP
jgi:hypothetical protein